MKPFLNPTGLSAKELKLAFAHWYRNYPFSECDKDLAPYLSFDIKAYRPHERSWLRQARLALYLSTKLVSEKAQISKESYKQFERSEVKGTINLINLAKLADAMDCELIYAIRPKTREPYSYSIWRKLMPAVKDHGSIKRAWRPQKGQAVGGLAAKKMRDSKFKKKNQWSQKATSQKSIYPY